MTMTKSFVTNLTKLRKEANDPVVLPDASHVMLCSIHNSVKSASNFPQCEHKMLKLCPVRSHSCQKSNFSESSRQRKRSQSPRSRKGIEKRTAPQGQNRTTLRTSATIQNCQNVDRTPMICTHPSQKSQCPTVLLSSSFVNVGKTSSCPDRTCSCISNRPQPTSKAKRTSVKSQSTLEMSNLTQVHTQIARHIINTDETVIELKDEIEKVKSQLLQISISKGVNSENNPEVIISQLKLENVYLKKELDQKKRNQYASVKDIEKAREIMNDYEKKVTLLHDQAIKSSKLMKQSKEKFCKCLKEKENLIRELTKDNKELNGCIKNKDIKYEELHKAYEDIQDLYNKTSKKFEIAEENNAEFCECIAILENQLQTSIRESEQYRDEIKELENKMCNLKCDICQKLEAKIKKQKERFENRLKEFEENEVMLKKEISVLSSKIKDAESDKLSLQQLEAKYKDLQSKLVEYEKCLAKCRTLEDECQRQYSTSAENERRFENERREMRQLVDELTTVVKHNKVTLLKLSDINKQQEALLESQSTILSEKEEKIKFSESTIEILRKNSLELEREVADLKQVLSGPCRKDACLSIWKQLEEVRKALSLEKDNHLVKEKIIEDQSQTICSLQNQIKDKMWELSKAKEETVIAEKEMARINNDLLAKHRALEKELHEKELLLKKLKKLEYQKTLLSREMEDLQILLQQYCESEHYNEEEREAIANLQKQVEQQRQDWEAQKANLANEKELAIRAAKFATQKLLDTVTDFQKQVDTQKKVQTMLTKMLHDKEEELKIVKSKIFSINSITSDLEIEVPVNEIFKRNNGIDLSNPATTSSFYTSFSNGSGCVLKPNFEETELKIFELNC